MKAGIFADDGTNALVQLAALPSALAFDLDGTLAPIVADPADARVPDDTAELLKALSRFWPIGIITGRGVDDARHRIGFTPQYLYGNHGAERRDDARTPPESKALQMHLNPVREHVSQNKAALAFRGIVLEDKGLSLALHYAENCEASQTRAWLDQLILPVAGDIHSSHGHQVMNVVPRQAPDKGDALLEIMQDCGAVRAFMIGDDVNDESAFGKAPRGSVTVRVGPLQVPTQARFVLSSQLQINRLLSNLLALRA